MATYTNLNDLFTAMANAIREKKDSTESIIADNFPTEIENLRTGFDYNNQDVTIIPDYAFYGCEDLNSVDCYNLTNIGASAFENCTKLRSVILYEGVESVGENAFKGCNCIIYCRKAEAPEGWDTDWNPDNCAVIWLYKTPVKTWDCSATNEDDVTVKLYNDVNNGNFLLVIDGSGNMKHYKDAASVPWWSDYGWSYITSIKINNGITRIGDRAFATHKNLTSITIPDSVTSIGDSVFYYCDSLVSINYTGTIAQWNTIAFGDSWNNYTGDYTVYCTDGIIAKDGTITYHNA